MRRLQTLILAGCLANAALAADRPPVASWSFDQGAAGDELRGFHKFVDGVAGKALRFDGQTTAVVRAAAKMPRLSGAFSVEAWVAIQTYPWTWCAIANQEKDRRAGYFFGVDPEGHFGLQLAVNGGWQECRSGAGLPLYAWNHLLGTYDPAAGITLYLNGKLVGERRSLPDRPVFAPGRCLDRSQPDASRAQPGDQGRRAGRLFLRRDHRRGPDPRCRAGPRRSRGRVLPRRAVRPRAARSARPARRAERARPLRRLYARLRYAEEWERPGASARRPMSSSASTRRPTGSSSGAARAISPPGSPRTASGTPTNSTRPRSRRWRRAPSPWPTSRPASRTPASSRATTPGSSSSGGTPRSASITTSSTWIR